VTQIPPNKPPARGLGRGLDALLPARSSAPPRTDLAVYGDNNVFRCALDKLQPQRAQPRRHFDSDALDELAASIREHGLLEPLVVRRMPQGDQFEIIAGERRWRAAQKAGLREVLVVVRDVSSKDAFELALIENVQREDLDAIEFAEALQRLVDEHGYTQDSLAQRVGKDRSTIANALRLLKLPSQVRERVINGELSEGHARALLGAPDVGTLVKLAERVIRGHLNVRQTEELVRSAKRERQRDGTAGTVAKSASVRDLETRLCRKLGTRCEVADHAGKGRLLIHYGSLEELDRILEMIL
jgi:ParB family transcriptional regulator, chromosome partitioning protein